MAIFGLFNLHEDAGSSGFVPYRRDVRQLLVVVAIGRGGVVLVGVQVVVMFGPHLQIVITNCKPS